MSWTTTINHGLRKSIGLDMNEFSIADFIYYNSTNPEGKIKGWCYASRQTMADEFGLSKRSILSIVDKLIQKGFVKKHPTTKHLKTTKKWFVSVPAIKHNLVVNSGEESSPVVKKVHQPKVVKKVHRSGEESSPIGGEESSPNTIYINTLKDNSICEHAHAHEKNLSSLNASSEKGSQGAGQNPKDVLLNILKQTSKSEKALWQGILGKRSMLKAARIFVNHKLSQKATDSKIQGYVRTLSRIAFRADFEKSLNWIIEVIDKEEAQNGKTKQNNIYHR